VVIPGRDGSSKQAQEKPIKPSSAQIKAEAQAGREFIINTLIHPYITQKTEWNRQCDAQSENLSEELEAEIQSAKQPPGSPGNEKLKLYLISTD
jgi:hypothetical protein